MSVLNELIYEFNKVCLSLWVFLECAHQCSDVIHSLLTIIREAWTWSPEMKRSNPAVRFILLDLLFHNPQNGKISMEGPALSSSLVQQKIDLLMTHYTLW